MHGTPTELRKKKKPIEWCTLINIYGYYIIYMYIYGGIWVKSTRSLVPVKKRFNP